LEEAWQPSLGQGEGYIKTMRKIYLIGLALFAVFAFSAVAASSAFAVSKILWNGAEITALLNIEIEGALLLGDLGRLGSIVCEGIFDGMLEAGGELGFIEELLTLTKELLAGIEGGDKLECSGPLGVTCEVEVLEMPWHVEIVLDGSVYLVDFLEEAGKIPTYHIRCPGVSEDLCTGLSSARLNNTAEGLLGYFNGLALTEPWGAESEETNCTVGGAKTGFLESGLLNAESNFVGDTELGGGVIRDTEGGTLTVSE
jgi:hypothetical protein